MDELAQAVAALDAIPGDDPEAAQSAADAILLDCVPVELREAYRRLVDRCSWWAHA